MEFKLPVLPEGFEWHIVKGNINGALLSISIYNETKVRYSSRRIGELDVAIAASPMQLLSETFIELHDELLEQLAKEEKQAREDEIRVARVAEFKKLIEEL